MITLERGTVRRLKRELTEVLGPIDVRVRRMLIKKWRSETFSGLRCAVFLEGDVGTEDAVYRLVAEADYTIPYFLVADTHLVSGGVSDGVASTIIEFLLLVTVA